MNTPKKQCETCKHFDSGVILWKPNFNYPWATCVKNWSDKQNGVFYGVLKNTCGNHAERKQ